MEPGLTDGGEGITWVHLMFDFEPFRRFKDKLIAGDFRAQYLARRRLVKILLQAAPLLW